jgi:hypothetical protein
MITECMAYITLLLFCTSTKSMTIEAPFPNHLSKGKDLSLPLSDEPKTDCTFTMTNFSCDGSWLSR